MATVEGAASFPLYNWVNIINEAKSLSDPLPDGWQWLGLGQRKGGAATLIIRIPSCLDGRLCALGPFSRSFRVRRASLSGIEEKLDDLNNEADRRSYWWRYVANMQIFWPDDWKKETNVRVFQIQLFRTTGKTPDSNSFYHARIGHRAFFELRKGRISRIQGPA